MDKLEKCFLILEKLQKQLKEKDAQDVNGILVLEEKVGIVEQMIEIVTPLQHYHDTTVGLWAMDQDPKEQSHGWIMKNAFQLK